MVPYFSFTLFLRTTLTLTTCLRGHQDLRRHFLPSLQMIWYPSESRLIRCQLIQAVTNYKDAKMLAELSEDLGEAMVGINESEIAILMAERGK